MKNQLCRIEISSFRNSFTYCRLQGTTISINCSEYFSDVERMSICKINPHMFK
jgi:hypothetical protein